MTNEINKRYFDLRTAKKEERLIDLSVDDGSSFSSRSVIDAINAARWETEGRACKSCRASLMGYNFFTEAVSARLSTRECLIDPEFVRVGRGDRVSFPSLCGALPEDTRIYIPVPASKELLAGAKGYFKNVRLFAPDCVFDKPSPSDISVSDMPPEVIFLSLSNDTTGLAFTYSELCAWVEYAKRVSAVIIFDTTLGIFCEVSEWRGEYPSTIYEIPGACECVVEVCSLSPSYRAGIPCGYCVIPSRVDFRGRTLLNEYDKIRAESASGFECHTSYIMQRGAAAHFSPAGRLEAMRIAKEYQRNAARICAALALKGFECTLGGVSPYVFGRFCPDGFYPPFSNGLGSVCECFENGLSLRVLHGDGEYIRVSGTVTREAAEEARLRILGM